MSNSLAIATVSAALAAVITKSVQEVVSGSQVVIGQPHATPPGDALHWVQLCLYQVSPNVALRNADLPTRNSAGKLSQKPQVALDLHYLLAFYGDEKDFEAQRMLGAVARDLHANPILTAKIIRDAVASWPVLAGSNLSQAQQQVKLTPLTLSLEELSKLWSVFFQTPYALSIAYHVSVVLIEAEDSVNPAPPVLQRGKNDSGVNTLLGAFPQLEKIHISFAEDAVEPSTLPSLPNAWLGLALKIQGKYLQGDIVTLRFSHPLLGEQKLVIAPENTTPTSIGFRLPDDVQAQTDWAAGIYTLSALVERNGETHTSNQLSLNLAAKISQITPANPVPIVANTASVQLTVSPKVLPKQELVLMIGDRQIALDSVSVPSNQVDVVIPQAKPMALQTVYLRVDGVDSLPIVRGINRPHLAFDERQKVALQ